VSAATHKGLRRLDSWVVRLWLCAPQGSEGPGRWNAGNHGSKVAYADTGPMTGIIRLHADPAADCFAFIRPGRAVVRVAFSQVATWAEVAPPPRPPLPVEQVPR
jgi:hypothetical protein